MRRRVAIARAIVTNPQLILYDSPTGGLDPITSTTIIELVMKQRDVSHTSSIVVTHRLQDAFMLAMHRFNLAPQSDGSAPAASGRSQHQLPHAPPGPPRLRRHHQELVHSNDPFIHEYIS